MSAENSDPVITSAPPPVTLQMTGTFAVLNPAGSAISGMSRRGQALLAYLAHQSRMRAERSSLADILWSDRSQNQARASLRQELATLRKQLPGGTLSADRQHVWLDASRIRVETEAQGDFMSGFDLASEGFEDWLRLQRSAASGDPDEAAASQSDSQHFFSRPAVLLFAFEALSSGDEDAMIAAGLADDLKTTLSYWRWFPVIGPEAIGWKTAKEADLRTVTAEVHASYAITGTLRCAGERVRISVGLTEAATGQTIWSESFEGTLDDIFAFQDDVSRAIVAQLEPQIARAEAARIARLRPASVRPWQLLAQADDIDRKGGEGYGTPESNMAQVRLMERALEKVPDFAPALARIGRYYFRAALLGWHDDRAATFATSLDFTNRALKIDPDNWEAHGYNGLVRIFGTHEYQVGRFHTSEAVRLNPSAALARHGFGCALEWCGQTQEALSHLNLIFRLNPSYPGRAAALGDITTCEMFLGNREAAVEAAIKLLAIAPDYARGLQRCVATFGYFGETGLAAKALEKLLRLTPDFSESYVRETYPYENTQNLEMLLDGLRKAGTLAG